jgi:hypothetical protein
VKRRKSWRRPFAKRHSRPPSLAAKLRSDVTPCCNVSLRQTLYISCAVELDHLLGLLALAVRRSLRQREVEKPSSVVVRPVRSLSQTCWSPRSPGKILRLHPQPVRSRSLWGSRGQRELSCAGELGSTDFYHEFRSILAQIFCVALIPLQIYVQGRSSTNVIMPNDEWKCLGNLPAIINELHHARDRRRYIVFCPVLSIELHQVSSRSCFRELPPRGAHFEHPRARYPQRSGWLIRD